MRAMAFAIALGVATPLVVAEKPKLTTVPVAEQKLLDKWIVRDVQIDGKVTPAQIGQKKGDVIEIKAKAHRFFLS